MIYDSSLYIFKLPFVSLLQLHLNGNGGWGEVVEIKIMTQIYICTATAERRG